MTWDTEDPFQKHEKPDFLGEGLKNIFGNLGGLDPSGMLSNLLVQKLRQIHREIGELIDKLEIPGYVGPNPWTILGVPKTATHEEVKKAYMSKSQQTHSDVGGTDEQQKLVNLAYELICQLKGWKK